MNIDGKVSSLGLIALLGLTGCMTNSLTEQPGDSKFGDANRQTMMAQIIDPDPSYDAPAEGSGKLAADAVERYRKGAVIKPKTISTTTGPK